MVLQRIGAAHPRVRNLRSVARNLGLAPARDGHPVEYTVVEAVWAHEMLLDTGTPIVDFFWCPEASHSERVHACARRVCEVARHAYRMSPGVLQRLSGRRRSDGLLSLVRLPDWNPEGWTFGGSALVLVADGIEYAGNLGALIRIADASGATCLIMTNRRIRRSHREVFGASRGTVLTMPILQFPDVDEAAAWLDEHNFEVVVADPNAERCYRERSYGFGRTAVVVGSEGRGASAVWCARGSTAICIPMLGVADSLNVAASAAIVLYEVRARKAGW